jgi:hypothetical protein
LKFTLIIFLFCFSTFIYCQSSEKKITIAFDAKITSVVGAKINIVKVLVVRDNILIDSLITQNGRCLINLDTGYSYKIYFTKTGYVSKHLLVVTKDLPETYPSKSKIKVDVSLFKSKPNLDLSFLNNKPIGVATYNFVSKKIQWDAEYTRLMIDKIIQATVEHYDKTKNNDE